MDSALRSVVAVAAAGVPLPRDATRDPNAVTAEQALEMATLGGATALRMQDQVGSLEPGKADTVVFDTANFDLRPLHNPVANIVHGSTGHSVDTVLIGGEVVLRHKQLTSLDEAGLRRQVEAINHRGVLVRVGTSVGEEAVMGYRLQMSAEIYDWLAELRSSDPPAAALAAQALAALAADGDRLGPPLVAAVEGRLRPDELLPALDRRYQARLESVTAMRRRVAEAATLRKDIERQLAELESPQAARDEAAGLRERLAAAIEAEARLTAASQRGQMRVDAFRTRKEVLKAAYTAARAEQLIEQAQDADADLQDDPGWPAVEAAGWLDEITGQIQRELGQDAAAEDLMELRPGAPADSGIRILFAVEPPGTALLIAVLDGSDAVRDHYREAVLLASGVLRGARTGPLDQAAEPGARTFADAPSFLEEFFPGRADELSAGAAALVAANRARTLAEQRIRLGLTQAQVAARMGVRQERVSAIERAEPGATEIRTLAGYVEALGGRLDIVADFGAERILLR